MQTIKKVLNSSVVLVVDERGAERVLLGKGIGFGAKAGEVIEASAVDQVFVALDDADQRNLVELLAQIPPEFVELTRAVVADAEEQGLKLDPHVYLALTDHLHFAVERQRRGLAVANRLAWEMRSVYPVQYAVGERAVAAMRSRLGVDVPDDEAANVAFHLANAELGKVGIDSLRIVQLIRSVTAIIQHTSGAALDREDLRSARFVAHLQYFAERFFSGGLLVSSDDFLFTSLSTRYPRAVATAERVRAFVRAEYGAELPNEEVAFLALHIARAAPE
ncbi:MULTISPECIES: PRD domain-containing protein [unclassified Rathayibacter]|uniref:PRD domain-containing protein n=1 Tax=unclassified Rathayibacter TaxID=2609250 RepID=UPI001053E971|nr:MULTISPECIES: PRD domain-containing protein [unclassified Rathayibacter]MCJ1683972.1 PRD domain-containing protein [Rathayibacter sp. VKM Ac-2928]MCJ1702780.1 PRD domain-containing protein [Rathayibacter sp. VKM Ac-2926]NQX16430.1 PRD domain-containing protein [Rathayibacter sp. VKM Ac-2857]TCL80078.1 BglG family transcriptional antiterminator [Rathayibacter sp. PhB192]TCM25519.1 BglG family transcriptional antiterminator [Rathayibacter sp. PhB179]